MPPKNALLVLGYVILSWTVSQVVAFPKQHLDELREETREAFYHGWNHYLRYGFPEDEIAPVTCIGRGRDRANPNNIGINDVLGDYSLTLVDSLDTLAMMDDQAGFESAVKKVERFVHFDLPSRVQVFETTIRMLGGLLSGHIYATSDSLGHKIEGYDGSLLSLAVDLANRLLPAFDTPTGIPLARVNLRYGNKNENITETCTAGAASLVLEFATLSRLTGDDKYEKAARKAFFAVWDRRTSLNVVGSALDAVTGLWLSAYSGIGASVDSFFEYALKSYILLDDESFLDVFSTAYAAIKENILDGWIYRNIHILTGSAVTSWIDSLAAFFPGLQVLAGDINAAVRSHLVYYRIWMTYAGLPERWNYAANQGSVELGWYGLRPEFVESNYFLYRATKDPFYLHVGAQILSDIQARCRTRCGYAALHDVRTDVLEDRMESFFLSETIKYLYLLFDVDNPLNKEDSNFVFSTEAHPLRIDSDLVPPERRKFMKLRPGSTMIPRHGNDDDVEDKDLALEYSPFTNDELDSDASSETDSRDGDDFDSSLDLLATSTCQNVNGYKSFYSFITSWGEFYHLNGLYNFTPIPDEVFPLQKKTNLPSQSSVFSSNMRPLENGTMSARRAIIDLPPTHPEALSLPLRSFPIWELFFPAESRSRIWKKGNDLEAPSFDGHRVRFSKLDGSEGGLGGRMKVLTFGGIKVSGNVKVRSLMSQGMHDQDILEVLRDGRVRLHGEDVVNLLVG
ncbi:glycoside hydrolase [Lipomyces kononenkoae]|uniref:Glycoside hydrolase n=1 Tax=Lipomyces kononenkoae TaxID=34357 RepID=A0ACC3T573_LIPKO